jgi:hypothetical protein
MGNEQCTSKKSKPSLMTVEKISEGYIIYPQYGTSSEKIFVPTSDEISSIIHNFFLEDEKGVPDCPMDSSEQSEK